MARTLLYVARHGEQDHPAATGDVGLSPLGQKQADHLGQRLAAVDITQIHHSPLARAVQTCEVLARHLPNAPTHACDLVADRTPVPSAARRDEYPERWLPWLDRVPVEEQDQDAIALRGAVQRLGAVGDEDRCELLITHNFVIGWFVSQVLETPMWRWIGLDSSNCGLTILKWENGQAAEVVAFNDTGHL